MYSLQDIYKTRTVSLPRTEKIIINCQNGGEEESILGVFSLNKKLIWHNFSSGTDC
jgi:hypothetical protein